jgi:perosamine synthetase
LSAERIPLSAPDITQAEIDAVTRVLRTPRLSQGPVLAAFEAAVAAYTGARRAVAVSSGTAGLHLGVRALGLGPGDEVVTTPFSFVASASALIYEGVRPVFADVDPGDLNLDPDRVRGALTARTRAVLAVHLFGRPAALGRLQELCDERGLALIEDACEAIGATYDTRRVGAIGRFGVFAFYPNKQMTTGEGGVVVTSDDRLAHRIAALRNHGRDLGEADPPAEIGFNYRISELNCALGLAQLQRLDAMLADRERVAGLYRERLAGNPCLLLPEPAHPAGRVSWFGYVVRLAPELTAVDRDAIVAGMRARGIGCGRYFAPIHLQPYYRRQFGYREGDFPISEAASARTLALPFFNRLEAGQVDEVCETLGLLCRQRLELAAR